MAQGSYYETKKNADLFYSQQLLLIKPVHKCRPKSSFELPQNGKNDKQLKSSSTILKANRYLHTLSYSREYRIWIWTVSWEDPRLGHHTDKLHAYDG